MQDYRLRGRSAREIAAGVEDALRAGKLHPGDSLPPIRRAAEQLGVAPATVAAAYRTLRARGVANGERRHGTRVAGRPPLPVPTVGALRSDIRDLAHGNPDPALLPSLREALDGLPAVADLYPGGVHQPGVGHAEAHDLSGATEAAAADLRGDGIPAGRVTFTNGAMDSVERLLNVYLRPGDPVAVEDPSFAGILDVVGVLGLRPIPVDVDDDGPRPESLEAALAAGARAAVITPRAHNPTGAAVTEKRARALQRVLRARPDVPIIEDDHAGPIAGVPFHSTIPARAARWSVVRSVSKAYGPDLRVAYVTGDPETIDRLVGRFSIGPGWVSHLLQRSVAALLGSPAVVASVREAGRTYGERRDRLRRLLAERGIEVGGRSGFNLWVPVRSEQAVVSGLLQRDWAVAPGSRFRLRTPPAVRVTAATLHGPSAEAFADDLAAVLSRSPTRSG